LAGTVDSRDQKRRAEDCAENVSGVRNVQNNLRVERPTEQSSAFGASTTGTTGTSGAAASSRQNK
jgi:hypothetical protein